MTYTISVIKKIIILVTPKINYKLLNMKTHKPIYMTLDLRGNNKLRERRWGTQQNFGK